MRLSLTIFGFISGWRSIPMPSVVLFCFVFSSVRPSKADEIQTPEVLAQGLTEWSLKALPNAVAVKEETKIQTLRAQLFATYLRLINRIVAKNWMLVIGANPTDGFPASTYADSSNRKVVINMAVSFPSVNGSGQGDLTSRVLTALHELHNALQADGMNELHSRARGGKVTEEEYIRLNLELEFTSYRSAMDIVQNSLAAPIKDLDDWGISKMLPEEKRFKSKPVSEILELVPNSRHEQHYRKLYRLLKPGG